MIRTALLVSLALSLTPPAPAQSFVETFDGGGNVGGWTAGGADAVLPGGGHPGHFLFSSVTTLTPVVRSTTPVTPFTGDLRSRAVRSVGIDLQVFAPASAWPGWRELTVVLAHEQGLPGVWQDDLLVAANAGYAPRPGQGWRGYDVLLPSQSTKIPAGWYCPGTSVNPDAQWNQVVTDVSYVMFFFGQVEQPYFFQADWVLGIDNVRVSDQLSTSVYCTPKANSLGCQSPITFWGTPSASGTEPFLLRADRVRGRAVGFFVYGHAPRYLWFNTLDKPCVSGPLSRTGVLHAGGKHGTCSGVLAVDFNDHIRSGQDPLLVPGAEVFGQFWYRDPAKPGGGSLSSAVQTTIQP